MTDDAATPIGPMSTGMITLDGDGNVSAFTLDGVAQPTVGGITGVLNETHRIFSSLLNGAPGIFMMSADQNHLFYLDNTKLIGALQRGGMPPALPYADTDIQNTMWSGSVARVSALMAPQATEDLQGAIVDGLGMFQFMAGTSTTNGPSIAMVGGTTNGQFRSASTIVNPAGTGFILLLMTPDKAFVGVLNSWGAYPVDCQFGAWTKN
jgi:hypothetical protein